MTAVELRPQTSAPGAVPAPRVAPPPARAVGLAMAAITCACYSIGAGRALDYDGSVTVGLFVRRGSLLDVFRSVYAFNNQPWFSFVEHIVWDAGGHGEAWLRIVPIASAVATVGILAAWTTARWGALAGLVAGGVLASNPMFATLGRSVRGYSLMVLGCVAATLVLADARAHSEALTRARRIAYVVGLGLAIGTQVYAVLVLAAHVAVLAADRRLDAGWRRRLAGALVVGTLPYLGMIGSLVTTARGRRGAFVSGFPASAAREVLGHDMIAVTILGAVCAFALVSVGWRRGLAPAVATIAGALLVVWTMVHPLDLYPRFVVWLVPAVALAAGWLVARHPRLTGIVALALAATVITEAASWTSQPIASRAIARQVEAARAAGLRPCATGSNGEVLAGYTTAVAAVNGPIDALHCDLVFGMPETSAALLSQLACRYRSVVVLPGITPIVVLSRPDPAHTPVC